MAQGSMTEFSGNQRSRDCIQRDINGKIDFAQFPIA